MDLAGGHGRNMGAAGTAIGVGAALGSIIGGQLAAVGPLVPLYGGAAVLVGGPEITLAVLAASAVRTISLDPGPHAPRSD